MRVKWIIESFSIINYDNNAVEYDKLASNKRLIGSFDYEGHEGYDNFLVDSETKKIEYIGLGIPQNFMIEDNFIIDRGILLEEYDFNTFLLNLKKGTIFSESNYSILDLQTDNLVCLFSLEIKEYQSVKVNDYLYLLFKNDVYHGFILSQATKHIDNYETNKSDELFLYLIKLIFSLVNEKVYEKMDNEDELIKKRLIELKEEFYNLNDSRKEGFLNFIENCFYAYYD